MSTMEAGPVPGDAEQAWGHFWPYAERCGNNVQLLTEVAATLVLQSDPFSAWFQNRHETCEGQQGHDPRQIRAEIQPRGSVFSPRVGKEPTRNLGYAEPTVLTTIRRQNVFGQHCFPTLSRPTNAYARRLKAIDIRSRVPR